MPGPADRPAMPVSQRALMPRREPVRGHERHVEGRATAGRRPSAESRGALAVRWRLRKLISTSTTRECSARKGA